MLLRKFRENGPDVIFLILIIMVFSWLGTFLHSGMQADQDTNGLPMPLYSGLLNITSFSHFFRNLVAFLLLMLTAFMVVNFNTSVFFISERTFLPAIIYVIFTGYIPQLQILNPVLLASPFLILGLKKIMDAYKVQGTAYSLFDAGILIGTGSLFYVNLVWYAILFIVAIAVLRPFGLKEFIIANLGLVTPAFIFTGFYYVLGYDLDYLRSAVNYNLFLKDASFEFTLPVGIALIIAGIAILISVSQLLGALKEKRIKSRKTFTLLFWTFIISAGLYLTSRAVSMEIYWFAVIPLTYFMTHFLVFSRRKRFASWMFTILLFLLLSIQILNLVV